MSDKTEIKPCLSCGCDDVSTFHNHVDANDTTPWSLECGMCEMTGSRWTTEDSAINAWNALPRREEFHAELMAEIMYLQLSAGAWKNDLMANAFNIATARLAGLANKYATAAADEGEG